VGLGAGNLATSSTRGCWYSCAYRAYDHPDALAATSDEIHASFLLEDALAIVFGGDEFPSTPSSLDVHQRRVLVAALDVPIVWSNPRVFSASFEQYSLPTTRDTLKKLVERQ
jgi:hypothetical protein